VAAALALVWLVALAFVFSTSPGWGYDFEAYLLAAHRLIDGASIYLPWTVDGPFQPGPYGLYLYSPPLAAAMLPFTAVSVPAATALWFAIRAGLLVAGVALMPVQRWIRLLMLVVAVLSEPVLTDLNLGNVSLVVMCLTVVAWRYLDRPPAAVAVAVVMSVRPTFGLFLISWLVRRRWRQAAVCVAAGLVLIAVSLPFVGIDAYLDYLKLVRNLSGLTGVINNFDLGSTVARLGLGETAATGALLLGYATAIAATLLSLRRDREVRFMVTLGATLLLSPLLQDHFLISALLPMAFLLQRGRRPWIVVLMAVLLWVPGPGVPVLALLAMLAPFLAPARVVADYAAASPERAASKWSTAPG
jgi:Glycosyltransferase family 87